MKDLLKFSTQMRVEFLCYHMVENVLVLNKFIAYHQV